MSKVLLFTKLNVVNPEPLLLLKFPGAPVVLIVNCAKLLLKTPSVKQITSKKRHAIEAFPRSSVCCCFLFKKGKKTVNNIESTDSVLNRRILNLECIVIFFINTIFIISQFTHKLKVFF